LSFIFSTTEEEECLSVVVSSPRTVAVYPTDSNQNTSGGQSTYLRNMGGYPFNNFNKVTTISYSENQSFQFSMRDKFH